MNAAAGTGAVAGAGGMSGGDAGGAVLLADVDRMLLRDLAEQLQRDGYCARIAHTAGHARALAALQAPRALIVGELDRPRDALELLAEIREGSQWDERLPVIVLGGGEQRLDLLRAFTAGADDFLARPPEYLELRARLTALLRRTLSPAAVARLRAGPLVIDSEARNASLGGHPLPLRRLEYDLLVHLARDPHRVCARSELLRKVWGLRASVRTRTLDSHASRLRGKLAALDPEPTRHWLVNVRGIGYRLL